MTVHRRPRFDRLHAGLRVGSDFFARSQLLAHDAPQPRGLVDSIAELSHPGLDAARIHPAIVAFFEDTSGLDLFIRSRWRFPISIAWTLARPLMARVGQFVLPRREAHITTRAFALDLAPDAPRGARAIVREYRDSGAPMQLVAYATWSRGERRYLTAAFPLPAGYLLGILRLDPLGEDADGRLAVELTSKSRDGDDAGVWFCFPRFAFKTPLGESLKFWAPGMTGAPRDLGPAVLDGTTLLTRHEQSFFGVRFVTHDYWFKPRSVPSDRALPPRSGT